MAVRATAALIAMLVAVAGCAAPTDPPAQARAAQPAATLPGHAALGPFAFDYPAGWTVTVTGNPAHYETVFGFLAAPPASASETCGPDYIPGGGACDDTLVVPPGSVLVSFRTFVNGACHPTADEQIAQDLASGWSAARLSGLAAAADRPAIGEGSAAWTWQAVGTGAMSCDLYELAARFGPRSAALAAAVDAVVGSVVLSVPAP